MVCSFAPRSVAGLCIWNSLRLIEWLLAWTAIPRTDVIKRIAYRIQRNEVPDALKGYRIFRVNTTALVGEDGTLLYSFYHNNDGDPLGTTISAIKEI